MAEKFEGRVYNDFGMVNIDEMKNLLWTRVKSEDYEEPKRGYVPKDPKLRFEWEGEAHLPTHLLPYDKDLENEHWQTTISMIYYNTIKEIEYE